MDKKTFEALEKIIAASNTSTNWELEQAVRQVEGWMEEVEKEIA